eukprot:COSAG02_NODE_41727_length_391_cov_1.239726_1_plen_61_part_10
MLGRKVAKEGGRHLHQPHLNLLSFLPQLLLVLLHTFQRRREQLARAVGGLKKTPFFFEFSL